MYNAPPPAGRKLQSRTRSSSVPGELWGKRQQRERSKLTVQNGVIAADDDVDNSRRKFLTTATSAMGAVGAAFVLVPFVSSWKPSERARALVAKYGS